MPEFAAFGIFAANNTCTLRRFQARKGSVAGDRQYAKRDDQTNEFLIREYSSLAPEFTPEFAVQRGREDWRFLFELWDGIIGEDLDPGRTVNAALSEFSRKLGLTVVRTARDELQTNAVPAAMWEEMWLQRYVPAIERVFAFAAAWAEWVFSRTPQGFPNHLEGLEQAGEYYNQPGMQMGRIVIDYREEAKQSGLGWIKALQGEESTSHRFVDPLPTPIRLVLGVLWASAATTLGAVISFVIGALLGVVPGLLLGLLNWHEGGAYIVGFIFGVGYISQRRTSYGDVNWVTYVVGGTGAVGVGISIWIAGSFTS